MHAKADAVAQLVFAHPAGRSQRQDDFFPRLLREIHDGFCLLRVVNHLGPRSGLDIALQIQRDAVSRPRHVERMERQVGRAAHLEAAAGEQDGEQHGEEGGFCE